MKKEVRLIDANVAKEYFCAACSTHKRYGRAIEECRNYTDSYGNRCFKMRLIDNIPSAPQESLRPKGRWEKYWCETDLIGHMYEVCPNCLSCEILDTDKFWDSNYCPNCGAKMDG